MKAIMKKIRKMWLLVIVLVAFTILPSALPADLGISGPLSPEIWVIVHPGENPPNL